MFAAEQLPYTCSAAVLMSLQPILVTLSKNKQGQFDYSVPTSTMLSEVGTCMRGSGGEARRKCGPRSVSTEEVRRGPLLGSRKRVGWGWREINSNGDWISGR